jgi:hypothetical protein
VLGRTRYHFDRIDLAQLFRADPDAPSSSTAH